MSVFIQTIVGLKLMKMLITFIGNLQNKNRIKDRDTLYLGKNNIIR